jgi:hypothetical protein
MNSDKELFHCCGTYLLNIKLAALYRPAVFPSNPSRETLLQWAGQKAPL